MTNPAPAANDPLETQELEEEFNPEAAAYEQTDLSHEPGAAQAEPGTAEGGSGRVRPRVRADIAAMAAYKQGIVPTGSEFKLSSNENPFPPLDSVLREVQEFTELNRYPDASAPQLREQLAAIYGVTPEEVQIGPGSVALLEQVARATVNPGDEVIYAWRSFEAYPGLVRVAHGVPVEVPLTESFEHDLEAMLEAITERTAFIILCSPNNPTGNALSHDEVASFLDRVPPHIPVVLDEAYVEFVADADRIRSISLYEEHPNLIIMRTFSKAYGLAGLRVGYCIADEGVLTAMRVTQTPLSVTAPAAHAALASLELRAQDEMLARVTELSARRDRLRDALTEDGWPAIPPSQSNFLWLDTGEFTSRAAEIFFEHGVIVRAFAGEGVRVSIGEAESLEPAHAAARAVLAEMTGRDAA